MGVDHNVIRLTLFPFSFKEKVRNWFHNLAQGSIEKWGEIFEAFLTKFFTPQLTSQLRAMISQFRQSEQKALKWDRFKELLRNCPQHGYEL